MKVDTASGLIGHRSLLNVIDALSEGEALTRTQIADRLELSPASVTRAVAALMQCGLIEEEGLLDAVGRGRRAATIRIKRDGLYTLGVHMETHSMKLCLLDGFGSICEKSERSFEGKPSSMDLSRLVAKELAGLDAHKLDRLAAVGVSMSGRVDVQAGRIKHSEVWDWMDVDLASDFSRALDRPIYIENDVKAALIWEKTKLGRNETDDLAYLYSGHSGIGLACMSGGTLIRGRSNAAGEIEDVSLGLEGKMSEHLIARHMIQRARIAYPAAQSLSDLLEGYRLCLPWAKLLLDDFIIYLNTLLRLIDAMMEPHHIILGGETMEQLSILPGFPKGEIYSLGRDYASSCAAGAARIAMQKMLLSIVSDLPLRAAEVTT